MPSRRPPAVWLMLLLLVTLPQACDRPRGRAAAERRDALAEALSLSPEYSVDLPVLAAAQNSQRAPKIARGGAEMLAVWEDERSGPSGIYATRISSAGTILDPHGIRLTTAPGFQHSPAVAFDGTQYLVVWVDGQVSLPGGGIHSDIQGARIRASDGTVLDPAGLRITTTSVEEEGFPAVACAGGNCLVVWQTYLDGDLFRIRGVRVNGAGTVLDSAELLIDGLSDGPTAALFPDIASDGDQYLVVWQQSGGMSDVFGRRVSSSGLMVDTAPLPIAAVSSTYEGSPAVAFGSSSYLVAWLQQVGATAVIAGGRVSPDGGVLDSTSLALSAGSESPGAPTVAFDGTAYLIAWESRPSTGSRIHAIRAGQDGVLLDPAYIPVSATTTDQQAPAIAYGGSDFFTLWEEVSSEGPTDLLGTRVTPQGAVRDAPPLVVASAANAQSSAVAADLDGRWLVVWQDMRNRAPGIFAARLERDGGMLDPGGIEIARSPYGQYFPAVAANGGQALVVWAERRSFGSSSRYVLLGARLNAAGQVLDPTGVTIRLSTGHASSPAVSSNGAEYLVAWREYPTDLSSSSIRGTRVSAAGAVLDPSTLPIADLPGTRHAPDIAFDGTRYVVTWQDNQDGDPTFDVYGAYVLPDGGLPTPTGLRISDGSPTSNPRVASDGVRAMVVWQESRDGGAGAGLRSVVAGAFLEGGATEPSGQMTVFDAPDFPFDPVVEHDGTHFVVTGRRLVSGGGQSLSAARVTSAGELLDPSGIRFDLGSTLISTMDLASDRAGTLLVAYDRFLPEPPYQAQRVVARFLGPTVASPPGGSCTLPSDCASNQCVSGVCCETECSTGSCRSGVCEAPDAGEAARVPLRLLVGCGCAHVGLSDALVGLAAWVLVLRLRLRSRPTR